jgi:hypothetical protein
MSPFQGSIALSELGFSLPNVYYSRVFYWAEGLLSPREAVYEFPPASAGSKNFTRFV